MHDTWFPVMSTSSWPMPYPSLTVFHECRRMKGPFLMLERICHDDGAIRWGMGDNWWSFHLYEVTFEGELCMRFQVSFMNLLIKECMSTLYSGTWRLCVESDKFEINTWKVSYTCVLLFDWTALLTSCYHACSLYTCMWPCPQGYCLFYEATCMLIVHWACKL